VKVIPEKTRSKKSRDTVPLSFPKTKICEHLCKCWLRLYNTRQTLLLPNGTDGTPWTVNSFADSQSMLHTVQCAYTHGPSRKERMDGRIQKDNISDAVHYEGKRRKRCFSLLF
jgi:hypothetical protein